MNTLVQLVATVEKSGMKAAGRYWIVHLFCDNITNNQEAESCRCVLTLTRSLKVFFSFLICFLLISTAQFVMVENGVKNKADKFW